MFAHYDITSFPTILIKFTKNINDSDFKNFLDTWMQF